MERAEVLFSAVIQRMQLLGDKNTKMKKLTVLLMSIALVAVGAIFAFGQKADNAGEGRRGFGQRDHGSHQGRKGNRGGMGRLFRQLELTDAQKDQLKQIRKAGFDSTKSIREQMHLNRQQLSQATAGGNFDEAQVNALAQQQGQLHAQMIVERQRMQAQMFAVLTPEQKAKAAELKDQFEQKHAERKAAREAAKTDK